MPASERQLCDAAADSKPKRTYEEEKRSPAFAANPTPTNTNRRKDGVERTSAALERRRKKTNEHMQLQINENSRKNNYARNYCYHYYGNKCGPYKT